MVGNRCERGLFFKAVAPKLFGCRCAGRDNADSGNDGTAGHDCRRSCLDLIYSNTDPTVVNPFASSSEMVVSNSCSSAMRRDILSRESALRSSINLFSGVRGVAPV